KFHDNRFGGGFGGPLLPGKFLGGKTYFYGFYEGRRFPGTAQIQEWTVPSAAMRAGIIKLRDPVTKVVTAYNLNPTPTLDPTEPRYQSSCVPVVEQICANPQRCQWRRHSEHSGAALSLPEREDYGMLR